jgi:hypothetical protein
MAKAADSTITPDTDCNALMTAALQAADQAAREPDRLRQRELEQQAVRLWHSARGLRRRSSASSLISTRAGFKTARSGAARSTWTTG